MYWSTCFAIRKDHHNFLLYSIKTFMERLLLLQTLGRTIFPTQQKTVSKPLKISPSLINKILTGPWAGVHKLHLSAPNQDVFHFHPLTWLDYLSFYPIPTRPITTGSLRHLNTEWAFPRGPGIHPEVSPGSFGDRMPSAYQNWCPQSLSDVICEHNPFKRKHQNKDFC